MDVAGVIVDVNDQGGPDESRVEDITDLAEGGRGLLTVEALAMTWSCTGEARGRTVRATFPPFSVARGRPRDRLIFQVRPPGRTIVGAGS